MTKLEERKEELEKKYPAGCTIMIEDVICLTDKDSLAEITENQLKEIKNGSRDYWCISEDWEDGEKIAELYINFEFLRSIEDGSEDGEELESLELKVIGYEII